MSLPIIDTIRSRGFWRFNFQPNIIKRLETSEQCRHLIEKNKVSLTGWDFPHVPRRNDDTEGTLPGADYLSGWCNYGVRKEYWRVYKSSQFLFLKALREDWFTEDPIYINLSKHIAKGKALGTASTIYDITQSLVLLSRITESGLYEQGVHIHISLEKMEGRELWIEERDRIPFFQPKVTGADRFAFSERFDSEDIKSHHVIIANRILRQIFDCFGWQVLPEQLQRDQNNLLQGKV